MTRIVCISDTHGYHRKVSIPDGDVLIHAGDATTDAGRASLRDFAQWFESQPHQHKIFVAGNHDFAFEKWPDLARALFKEVAPSCTYLQDSGCKVDYLNVWGSPVQPEFCDWAFNRMRGAEINRHWIMIPDKTDILITHGPSWRPGNNLLDVSGFDGEHCGCRDLYDAINRVQPDLHVFGHIHHGYGKDYMFHDLGNKTTFVNASICNEAYKPLNAPWVIDL